MKIGIQRGDVARCSDASCNPRPRRLRQEPHKFKSSLGDIARPRLQKKCEGGLKK
jgi:hypothetical protein